MNRKKVIIVGAGPGGLTSAMILAHRGWDVTVLEARDRVGGRNAALKLGPYTFDTGPTFLMMNFILKEMFEEAGRRVEDYLAFKRLDPLYELSFNDRSILVSDDPRRMREEIERVFPGESNGLDRFLDAEKRRYEVLFPCIQKDYSTLRSLFSPSLLKALPQLALGRSVFQNLGRYFRSEKLKLAFTFQAKYLGMSPWECPALFTMLPYVEHAFGIYHVMGGLNRISEAMANVVREHGGAIRLNERVASLELRGRAVTGVRLASGETLSADAVIVNADFAHAMSTLVPDGVLKKYSRAALAKKQYSCSTFMMYLGVKKTYPLRHHTIYFAGDYRTNVDDVFRGRRLSDDFSCYVQNASITDPSLAPSGKSTLYLLVPVPNRTAPVDWTTEAPVFREKVLSLLERRGPFHDLRAHIEEERILTPLDWERGLDIYRGATFNLAHTFSQLLYLRPRNRFEELDNCYLAGGGTHPGSGLPTIYESARITSNLLCRREGIPFRTPSPLASKTAVTPVP
jgi:phytoene desaturase